MSGYYEEPDPSEQLDTSGGGLRKQLEQALSEIRDLRKELAGDKRQDTVADLVKGMGLDPAVAELIPESEADPKGWLDKRAHLFGGQKAEEPEEDPTTDPKTVKAPEVDPALLAEQEALDAMNGAAASGSQVTVSQDLLDQVEAVKDPAELEKLMRQHGFDGTLKGF